MMSDARQDMQRGLSEETTRWLVILQSGELSLDQRSEFVDWLRESPTHIAELLCMGALDEQLAKLPLWRSVEPLADECSNVVAISGHARVTSPRQRSSLAGYGWAAAASVMVLAVAYLTLAHPGEIRLRTMPGEHRELALEDGSVVDLAPDTDLAVRYDAHRRGIALAHGQAMFRVARNPQRPFIVEAAGTQVRAVGTVFNVESGDKGILVSVVEGHVAVTQQRRFTGTLNSRPALAVVSLNPDEEVLIDPAGNASSVRRAQHSVRGVDQSETLSFENETVADVANKFNSRNGLHIDVLSPEVGLRRISGVFYVNDPESFIAFVEAVTDASVRREAPERVVIRHK